MSIETYGTGERLRVAARTLAPHAVQAHLVLLPIPTSRDGICVTGTDIPLSETLSGVEEGSVVVGYGLPKDYLNEVAARGGRALDISLDEDFLCENAYLTAVGTLGYILTTDTRAPRDRVFGIVGYGRIGSRLLRLLLFLGARVVIYTSRHLTNIELGECGVHSVCISGESDGKYDFSGIDILINTAPRDMSASFPEGKVPLGMRVLELASGKNFSGVEGVEELTSLPGRMYPASSGLAYAEAALKLLKDAPL